MVFRYGEYFIKIRVADGAYMDGQKTRVLGELHVREAVADHHGIGKIDVGKVVFCLQCHSDLGFAAATVFTRQMGATIDSIHGRVLVEQAHLHVAVHGIHLGLRANLLANALLVGNQHNMLELWTQQLHCLQKMVYKHKLIHGFDISAHNLHVHHAVPIQKQGIHFKKAGKNTQNCD